MNKFQPGDRITRIGTDTVYLRSGKTYEVCEIFTDGLMSIVEFPGRYSPSGFKLLDKEIPVEAVSLDVHLQITLNDYMLSIIKENPEFDFNQLAVMFDNSLPTGENVLSRLGRQGLLMVRVKGS
jgi:hypothetical protein